jgi:hypothetical protein
MTAREYTIGDSCHLHRLTAVEGCTTCARLSDAERAPAVQQLDLLADLAERGFSAVFILPGKSTDESENLCRADIATGVKS